MADVCVSRERMSDFLAGNLPADEESQIAGHLHDCDPCNRLALDLSDDPDARELLAGGANHAEQPGEEAPLSELRRRLAALAIIESSASNTVSAGTLETPRASSDASAETTIASPAPQRLGKFEIIRELGVGGFGVVYLARDAVLDRQVALKLPRSIRLVDPGAQQRFFREAQALARLDHPHVVPMYEAGEHEGTCYLAVAYCNGPTLDAWRRQQGQPIDPENAARIVSLLAEAVEHAHQQGILHRDIKPANVLLSQAQGPKSKVVDDLNSPVPGTLDFGHWTPKLADFGLAKMADEQHSSTTVSGTVLGTPDYLSPEQAAGMLDKFGPATDVYGLGAVLYELLIGEPPIRGSTTADTLRRILVDEPQPPREIAPGVPAELEAIVMKCLEKSTVERYAAAADLAADLRQFLAGQPVCARYYRSRHRGWRWLQQHPVRVATFLLLVSGLLIASLVAAFVVRPRDNASRRPGDDATASIQSSLAKESSAERATPALPAAIPPPPGLIAWWSGDGHAGDYVGGNHGILPNGVRFVPGMVGEAFALDGVDDYICIPHSDALNPAAGFTIECWVRSNAEGACRGILCKSVNAADDSYCLEECPDSARHFRLRLTESKTYDLGVLVGNEVTAPGQWAHLAATFENGTAKLYYNGKLDAVHDAGAGRKIHASTADVFIGANVDAAGGKWYFSGLIDEVCIYNRALLGEEILAIYRAGQEGKIKPSSAAQIDELAAVHRMALMAELSLLRTEYRRATELYQQVWEARQRILGSLHGDTVAAESALGECLTKEGKYSEAEPHLLDSFAASQNAKSFPREWVPVYQSRLVRLYKAWGKPVEADKWQGMMTAYEGTLAAENRPKQKSLVKHEVPVIRPAIAPPPGLIAWWSGDGHANDSIGANHGELAGGATFGAGLVGQAFMLNGKNSYIRVPNSDALNPKGEFSIDCWIQSPCVDSTNIIAKWNMRTKDFSYVLQENGWEHKSAHRFMFGLSEHSQMNSRFDLANLHGTLTLTPREWVHVAATFDAVAARLYVNGSLDETYSPAIGQIHSGSTDLHIGKALTASNSDDVSTMRCLIDELCLYDRALAANEIEAIYRAGAAGKIKPSHAAAAGRPVNDAAASAPAVGASNSLVENKKTPQNPLPPLPGLVAWWSGDGHARDYAGDNDGKMLRGATFEPGLVGNAFSLDGIDDTIRVPNSDALNPTTGFTFECWIHPRSTEGWQKLISKWDDPDASYQVQKVRDTDLLGFSLAESPPQRGNLVVFKGARRVLARQWTHVGATYDGNVARIYFNGALDGEVVLGPNRPIHAGKTDVWIGSNNGHCFCGLMDEVSLYNRALSEEEIRSIYQAGAAGKIKPASAASNSGNDGAVARDSSSTD